ncbi:MAG: EAL domain-containing protein [Rhodocyclaceae bacterium]
MTHALAYERITALYAITADPQSAMDEKFRALLDLGRHTFELEIGCIARIADGDYEIVAAAPTGGGRLPGDRLPIERTYCCVTIASADPVGFDRASGSAWEHHPCFREFRLEAYLGARILVDDAPWGTLSFSSRQRGDHPHPEEDVLFLKLMAQWIGDELERALHDEKMMTLNDWRQALLDSANLAIIATDPAGLIVSFNRAAERMLDYTAEEMVGRRTPEAIHDRSEVVARAHSLGDELGGTVLPGFEVFVAKARRGLAEEREWSYIRKDGSRLPVLLSVTSVRDAEGRLQGFLGMAVDISQRKALEVQAAIARANEMSQRIVHAIGEGVIGVEDAPPHRVRFLNPAAQTLLGLGEHEVIGRPLAEIIGRVPAADGQAEGLLDRLVHGRSFEAMIVSAGREAPFPALFVSSHTLDESGLIVLTVQDVTARWEADEQLRLAEQVFEYSPEAILVTDGDGAILRVNPAFTLITGYPPEDVIGQNPRILRSDRHDADFYRAMWRALAEEDHWHGEIWDRRKNGEIYPKWLCINTVRLPHGITRHIALFADISERKAHEERIDYLARHDALTGLANRRLLDDRMRKLLLSARRGDQGVALLLIDLDRFKQVNDSLGHQVGDQLLIEVAGRLNASVREGDTVARLGGDEFVVLLAGMGGPRDVVPVAEKIRLALSQPVEAGSHLLHTSPSIGIGLYPGDGTDLDGLLQAADIAMYQVKAAGRNAWMFFESRMNDEVRSRHRLETDMRLALERGEFQLHYQPQFDVDGCRVIAWEALLRWQHPERGWIEPCDFIPVAEEIGLILPLGEWVLEAACREAMSWTNLRQGNERVAVNVSARQLEQAAFLDIVTRVLRDTGLPAERLELELTESALMNNTPRVQQTLHSLKDLGVHLTLDDFGTGYSSLAYLGTFAVDRLKIDRSFMLDIENKPSNAAIVVAVLALAKALGLEVVAEGVETCKQLAFLIDSGCLKAQGFLYGRPMPAAAIAGFVPGMQ